LLQPFINDNLVVHTGEAFPGLSAKDGTEYISKTTGTIAPLSSMTDSALLFSSYWNYQNIKVNETDSASKQVAQINKEEKPGLESRDLGVAVQDDTKTVNTKSKNILPPEHERYSAELKKLFADSPPDDEKSPRPNNTTGRGSDNTLWP